MIKGYGVEKLGANSKQNYKGKGRYLLEGAPRPSSEHYRIIDRELILSVQSIFELSSFLALLLSRAIYDLNDSLLRFNMIKHMISFYNYLKVCLLILNILNGCK